MPCELSCLCQKRLSIKRKKYARLWSVVSHLQIPGSTSRVSVLLDQPEELGNMCIAGPERPLSPSQQKQQPFHRAAVSSIVLLYFSAILLTSFLTGAHLIISGVFFIPPQFAGLWFLFAYSILFVYRSHSNYRNRFPHLFPVCLSW